MAGIFGKEPSDSNTSTRQRQDQSNQGSGSFDRGAYGNDGSGYGTRNGQYLNPDSSKVWNASGGPDGKGRWEDNPDAPKDGGLWVGQNGQGYMGTGGSFNSRTGMAQFGQGAARGNLQDDDSWGGSAGAIVMGPDGKPMVDRSQSGQAKDRARYRGLADAASGRRAHQMDYSLGDVDRQRSMATRGQQMAATGLLGTAAQGGAPSGAVIRGQGATDDAFMSALGAQAGARGGAANQGAATRAGMNAAGQQQLGVAGALGRARSSELTDARGAYSGAANVMRTGDIGQQSMDQNRQRARLANEMAQRELNQGRQIGMEGLAFDTDVNAVNAGLKAEDRAAGFAASSMAREQRDADRMASFYNKGIGMAGDLGKSAVSSMDEDPRKKGA